MGECHCQVERVFPSLSITSSEIDDVWVWNWKTRPRRSTLIAVNRLVAGSMSTEAYAIHLYKWKIGNSLIIECRLQQDTQPQSSPDVDAAAASPTSVAPPNERERRRPRLNTAALGLGAGGEGERKRGKSMFGVLVNTLNKAKAEDKERNASEAVSDYQTLPFAF